MRISGGLIEGDLVVGNAWDKYGSRNVVVRWLMRGFHTSLSEFVARVNPSSIHEVGCGEGYWVLQWLKQGFAARGSDVSTAVLELARANAAEQQLSPCLFTTRSVYDLRRDEDSAELVVCCEVLEHLDRPRDGLRALQIVASPYLILSVPREPLWRAMNIARGRYLTALGNTPGHVQHWSQVEFVELVSDYFEIIDVRTPIPWTMVLCRHRGQTL